MGFQTPIVFVGVDYHNDYLLLAVVVVVVVVVAGE